MASGYDGQEFGTLIITRMADGRLVVDDWVERIRIAPELLASEKLIETLVTIRAANGTRHYRVTGCTPAGDLLAKMERMPPPIRQGWEKVAG